MKRKIARPGSISTHLCELDQAISSLPTIEVRHPNAMNPGKRTMLWNLGRPTSLEDASAQLGQIIEARRPPQSVLKQLARLARIPNDAHAIFGDRLDAAVLVAWYPRAEGELPEFALIADDFAKVAALSRELRCSLQILTGPTKALLDVYSAPGYPGRTVRELERELGALLQFDADLQIAAGRTERALGGQRAALSEDHPNPKRRRNAHFERFAGLACSAVVSAGGRLTVNKNNGAEGTFPKFIELFRRYLPEDLVPSALQPGTLDRIRREVEGEYSRRQ